MYLRLKNAYAQFDEMASLELHFWFNLLFLEFKFHLKKVRGSIKLYLNYHIFSLDTRRLRRLYTISYFTFLIVLKALKVGILYIKMPKKNYTGVGGKDYYIVSTVLN